MHLQHADKNKLVRNNGLFYRDHSVDVNYWQMSLVVCTRPVLCVFQVAKLLTDAVILNTCDDINNSLELLSF